MPAPLELNRDATTAAPEDVTFGPRLGFLGAWEAGYEAQQRANSAFGLEYSYRELEQEQNQRIRDAGLKPPPSLNDDDTFVGGMGQLTGKQRAYFDAAKFFVDGEGDAAPIAERDKRLAEIKQQHPDLAITDYGGMFREVQKRAQLAEQRYGRSETTLGGTVGGFAGGVVASVQPETDPLNALTLGIGGGGKTVARRIATQAGGQGVVEAIDEVTGVQENRRLLSLSHGFAQGAENVAFAAVGGAALQGVGEGLGLAAKRAAKRWFRDTPTDPAPPPPEAPARETTLPDPNARQLTFDFSDPAYKDLATGTQMDLPLHIPEQPYGPSRLANLRAWQDLQTVNRQLDDFNGPAPVDVRPHSEVDPASTPVSTTVEDLARQIDPKAFQLYDPLVAEAEVLRRAVREGDAAAATREGQGASTVDDQIAVLEARAATLKNRKQLQRIRAEIDDLRTTRAVAVPNVPPAGELPSMRARLMKLDEKMRDLAPIVSRAYSAARDEWPAISAKEAAGLGGQEAPTAREEWQKPFPFMRTIANRQRVRVREPEQMSLFGFHPDIISKLPADAHAGQKVAAIAEADAKATDEALERFKARAAEALKPVAEKIEGLEEGADPNTVLINGRELHLDNDRLPTGRTLEDGTMEMVPLRSVLASVKKDNDFLTSIGTCSTK